MRLTRSAILYIAAALGAIAVAAVLLTNGQQDAPNTAVTETPAQTQGYAAIADLRTGDMLKLNFHEEPKPVSATPFQVSDGSTMTLADYKGQVVLLNFWATWCAPCRAEMPMLAELQTELGSDDFKVVTLATGRNPLPAIQKFFAEIEVDNLPLHRDPRQMVARDMGILGLPITMILDRNGQEVARLVGDAEWNSETAKSILKAVIEQNPAPQS